jgi:hypothetical protein
MRGTFWFFLNVTTTVVCVCSVSVGHVGNDFTWTRQQWAQDKLPILLHDGFASSLGKRLTDDDNVYLTSVLGTLEHDTWSEVSQRKREEVCPSICQLNQPNCASTMRTFEALAFAGRANML